MDDIFEQLLSDGVIDEVIGRLKSGKEAEVFLVRHRGEIVAAKVYKDRQQRNFKSNAVYKEGRQIRNSRTRRAVEKGSRFGQREAEEAWKSAEADMLYRLHAEGVRVPTPKMFYEGVLLMQLVTDAEGQPAPRLMDAPITVEMAGGIYRDIRRSIVGMLCCDLIHGDLSPYNVLLGADGATIIDFPQMMSAAHNNQSETFFRRDFNNIHRFLSDIDRTLMRARGDAQEIWSAYLRRDLTPDFTPSGIAREERRRPAEEARSDPRNAFPPNREPSSGAPPNPRPVYVGRDAAPPNPRPVYVGRDAAPPNPRPVYVGRDAAPPRNNPAHTNGGEARDRQHSQNSRNAPRQGGNDTGRPQPSQQQHPQHRAHSPQQPQQEQRAQPQHQQPQQQQRAQPQHQQPQQQQRSQPQHQQPQHRAQSQQPQQQQRAQQPQQQNRRPPAGRQAPVLEVVYMRRPPGAPSDHPGSQQTNPVAPPPEPRRPQQEQHPRSPHPIEAQPRSISPQPSRPRSAPQQAAPQANERAGGGDRKGPRQRRRRRYD